MRIKGVVKISVSLQEDVYEWLKKVSETWGISRSEIVNAILKLFMRGGVERVVEGRLLDLIENNSDGE